MASSLSSSSSSTIAYGMTNENLPYHVDIFLSEKIYNPGDIIYGEVIFKLNKNLSCDLINIQLFGCIRIFWIDKKAGFFFSFFFVLYQFCNI